MTEERIYLDYAATTPLDPRVLEAMMPYMTEHFGNPNSIHSFGREARRAIDEAREKIAQLLNCQPSEIVFTSGGTESDNLALRGVAEAYRHKGNHIVTTAIEHHAVLRTCKALEDMGFFVTYLPVDEHGLVSPEQVAEAVNERTILVSVMHANNEIGTIEPIAEIVRAVKEKRPDTIVHTDAVQTVGHIPVDIQELGVDLLSFSAHKFYGPKGIGGLFVRKGVRLVPQITGGGQERNRRSGTENVAAIVGMAKALELAVEEMPTELPRLQTLRDELITGVLSRIPETRLNGHPTLRLPHNANFSFRGIEGEALLLQLDLNGIAASSGSACSSGSLEPSHVLLALGLDYELAIGSLRITLGRFTTREHILRLLDLLPKVVEKLRALRGSLRV
ncbi:MAG: cysteine desulfurase NifS [Armatimonadetes bacterium]|nr:cysteine desulfurase NifS [Armatimonadota bacterium]